MIINIVTIAGISIVGAIISAMLATLPIGSAIHLCGLTMLILTNMTSASLLPPDCAIALTVAIAVGYTIGSTIPALIFQCTDESTIFFPPLGNRVAADGQLHHAVLFTGIGSLGAIAIMLLIAPFAKILLPYAEFLYTDFRDPLLTLALVCLICSLIHDSYRSSHTGRGPEAARLISGLITVFVSGLVGLILYYRPLTKSATADMHLTPLFLGLWVIPWLLQNINNRPAAIKAQPTATYLKLSTKRTIFAIISGAFIGLVSLLAAFASPCGMAIAGWFLLRRERRLQLIGQSAARTIIIVGGVLLLFIPDTHLFRGHFGWFFQGNNQVFTNIDFTIALAAMLIAAVVAFYMLSPMATMAITFARTFPRYLIPAISITLIIISVAFVFGAMGLFILTIGSFIGWFALCYGARRTSCLGAVLLPALINCLGLSDYFRSILSL